MKITINDETRDIEVRDVYGPGDGKRLDSLYVVGLYQKRPGTKLWRESITLWRQPDGSYRLAQSTTILNRAGYRLIGWADQPVSEKAKSRHNSAIRRRQP